MRRTGGTRAPRRSRRQTSEEKHLDTTTGAPVADPPGQETGGATPDAGSRTGHGALGDFRGAAGWTALGTLVPGAGLLNAGRRLLGWVALAPFLALVGAAVVLLLSGQTVEVARRFAFDADVVTGLAVSAGVVGLLWGAVVVVTHLAQRRHRGVQGRRVLSVLLVAALLAVVVAPAATAVRYALAQRSLLVNVFGADDADGTTTDTEAESDPWAGVPRVNVLLVGADTGADRVGTRPDTVIVASIDTTTGDTVIFGLPRQLADIPFPADSPAADLWPTACEENGSGGCWLNAVYLFGTQHPELYPTADDPGLAATEDAAAGITGLSIDYTAMVNLGGFQDLIDAMGGIRLTVERRIPIGGGERLNSAGTVVGTYPVTGYLEPGPDQLLDGYQAEWYARSRWQSDNNDRMNRQRCLINAAVKQYSVTDLALAFPRLASSAEQDVSTDIPASRLNAFIDLGLKVKEAPLRTLSFTEPLVSTGSPDYDQVHELVRQALVAPTATPTPTGTTTATPPATASAPTATATDGPTETGSPGASPTETAVSGEAVSADSVCP